MNVFEEKGILQEIQCGTNFACVLTQNNDFSATEYKVLLNQAEGCFLKCMKMMYNGKIQLYYLTENYKPLSSILTKLNSENFVIIVSNLFECIKSVKQNGLIHCENIDISINHIFVDLSTYKVKLTYLPLQKNGYDDYLSFENQIRSDLIKITQQANNFSSIKITQIQKDLINGNMSLDDLYSKLKGNHNNRNEYKADNNKKRIRLVAMDTPERFELVITKNRFKIGKRKETVDGHISFNKWISKEHCMIHTRNGEFYIEDINSQNGTRVNGLKLMPGNETKIKNGDIVRLANSNFQVVIE